MRQPGKIMGKRLSDKHTWIGPVLPDGSWLGTVRLTKKPHGYVSDKYPGITFPTITAWKEYLAEILGGQDGTQ